jgi:hypothetical protein
MSEAALTALIQPTLQPDETVSLSANGTYAPLEAHDSLTLTFQKLTGRWRERRFALALSDRRLHWYELSDQGAVTQHVAYRLPLKGRLVLSRPGVIELLLPGEPRRFLTFAERRDAAELCRQVDEQQQATQLANTTVPEVTGPGIKPPTADTESTPGKHGERTAPQHELVSAIRPSYRP